MNENCIVESPYKNSKWLTEYRCEYPHKYDGFSPVLYWVYLCPYCKGISLESTVYCKNCGTMLIEKRKEK
jgi:hypothetical protein